MDLSGLLSPLSNGPDCGQDLSFSPEFDAIAEARREDDPSLDQGEWLSAIKEADWPRVARTCEALLAERSKDLRLAGWLIEAWGRRQGIAGIARGLDLVVGLCEHFWEGLHPLPEEGDQELRIGALTWIATHAPRWLAACPLTESARGRYSLADLEAARQRATHIERSPSEAEQPAAGPITVQQFEAARSDTPLAQLEALGAEVSHCQAALQGLEAALARRLGEDAPSWAAVRGVLEALARYCGTATAQGAAGSAPAPLVHTPPVLATSAADAASGMSREQAIRQLREVARFFRRTEPHSPVAYLAEKAARWGEMPLHDWLRSVVRDGGELSRIEELLGLEAPGGEAQD